MISVPLGGKYRHLAVLIDDEDAEEVGGYRWLYQKVTAESNVIYARRAWVGADGKNRTQYLHTLLTGWPLVDHINHNGLDNRRANLRQATKAENARNSRKRVSQKGVSCTSAYKGVSCRGSAYVALVCVAGKTKYLGTFRSEIEAAHAYDSAARELFGEFAFLNFRDPA